MNNTELNQPQVHTGYEGSASYKMNFGILLSGMGFLMMIFYYWNELFSRIQNETVAMMAICCLQIGFSGLRLMARQGKDCRSYHNPQPISYVRLLVVIINLFVNMIATALITLSVTISVKQGVFDFVELNMTALFLAIFSFAFFNSLKSWEMMVRLNHHYRRASSS